MYVKHLKSEWHKKIVLSVCALFFLSGTIWAQNIQVTGKVTDKTGDAVPGVYVLVDGTRIGTTTGNNGNFAISAPSKGKLVFSSLGFKTLTVEVAGRSIINVSIEEDATMLTDVVVVGFGTQKKENLSGAVASVDTKVLEARPIADVGRGLQGVTPGFSVRIPSGEVGSDPMLRIRGHVGSIEGGSSPLILLDNVEIPSIQLINPDDIESISILKDAASASIYGAKAAFGVVLITSKRGAKQESVNVSYSANFSFQNISKQMEMGALDALEYTKDAMLRTNSTVAGAFWMVTVDGFEKMKQWQEKYANVVKPNDPMVYGRDWYRDPQGYKIGLRTYDPYKYLVKEWAPTQTHNLSINGKSGKTDYNMSVGLVDQSGMLKPAKKDKFERYNISTRVGTDVNKYIRAEAGAIYSKRIKSYPYATNSSTADPWLYVYRWGPTFPMVKTDDEGLDIRNATYELSTANTRTQETNFLSMNVGMTITPIEKLKVRVDYTHSNNEFVEKRPGTRFTAGDSWGAPVLRKDADGNQVYVNENGDVVSAGTPGAMQAYRLNYYTYTAVGSNPDHYRQDSGNYQRSTLNTTATYDFQIDNNHIFKLMAGAQRVGYRWTTMWAQRTEIIEGEYGRPQLPLAAGTQTNGGNANWESQLGFFGRLNYSFKDKYLIEANIRYDGTSKFPSHLQWRWFPSFSGAWRVTEESWMDWSKSFMSMLKVRGSWGTIGDQTVASSLYLPLMSGAQTNWVTGGARAYRFGSPVMNAVDITWQDITTLDLGVDARFFKGAFGISFDWYKRETNNMIIGKEGMPLTLGYTAPKGNYGSMRTNGFELEMDYNHRFKHGGFNISASIYDNKSVWVNVGSATVVDNRYNGKVNGEIWGYKVDRLFQKGDFEYDSNGNLITVDINGKTTYKFVPGIPVHEFLQPNSTIRFMPGDVKYLDLNGDGRIHPGSRTLADHGDLAIIGNSTPRYEYSFRLGGDYKGVDLFVFLQGIGSRQIWGDSFLAQPGWNSSDGAMPQAFAGNYWKEDRTDAFYPRAYNMAGTSNIFNMQRNDRYLLNMAYLRIKNISLGYTLPVTLTRKISVNKVRIYASLENFFTFDHLGTLPIDPEEIPGVSMWDADDNYNLGRAGVGAPTFKSASFGIQVNF